MELNIWRNYNASVYFSLLLLMTLLDVDGWTDALSYVYTATSVHYIVHSVSSVHCVLSECVISCRTMRILQLQSCADQLVV